MLFSYKRKVINKYLLIKCKYGAPRIVNDLPEHKWIANGAIKLLRKRFMRLVTLLERNVPDNLSLYTQNGTLN